MIDTDYLNRLEEYFKSGDCQFEFDNGDEDRRYAILDFLERLMEVAEQADELATKLIFKGKLDLLAGGGQTPDQGTEVQ
ncbi:hypothetical protein [Pseudodesulfovibrio tunisiensis]|uniref:hypothetical protein n=1 Tax=Pseudodesulfovibrio tunisiensis TaxID=463192 RepID=UPI001FB42AC0|nr:hypothetical protein [Pseudodesulfovibrio tunisiensis]